MRTAWKFELIEPTHIVADTPIFDVEFPIGSNVLDVQLQDYRPVFWVDLQDTNDLKAHRFAIVGTGQEIPFFVDTWEGTWQEGLVVCHLFSVDEVLYQLARKRDEE